MLKSVSSVSTCESHWSGAARLPLLRVRIGLQATSDVDPTECAFKDDKAEAWRRGSWPQPCLSSLGRCDESGQLSGPNADFECGSAASNLPWMTLNRCAL